VIADKRYWDSCCFLGWFQSDPLKQPACDAVLQAATDGKVLIVTSALVIAEVLNLRGHDPIPVANREKVEKFFRNDYIHVENITRRMAELSRNLVWDYGIKPKDALHLASAISLKLTVFNTFDEPLIKKWKKIRGFSMTVEHPRLDEPKLPM
jgi:predicted nucleic acid-binding protein